VPPLACQLGCSSSAYSSCMATLSISGYTPPYPRNDSAEHNPTTLIPPFPCNSRLSASTQVQPRDHPSNTAASLGRARSHTSATSRAALHAPASPLGSVMIIHCSGRAATGVAAGGVREVWWAPACVCSS